MSKLTPPLNKRRIGNAKNLINAAAFNRINTVDATCSLHIFCESLAVRCEQRQLYLKCMQLEKTVEIQASHYEPQRSGS